MYFILDVFVALFGGNLAFDLIDKANFFILGKEFFGFAALFKRTHFLKLIFSLCRIRQVDYFELLL